MENWEEKTTVKKGDFAEDIVHRFIEDKGYVVYSPKTKGPHAFDRLAIKNKEKVIIVDIKAKAKLSKFDETGFNYKHYEEYKRISQRHSIPVFIFFVDEMLAEIYGNFLNTLEKNSRVVEWGTKMILFQMKDMQRNIYKLNNEQVQTLKQFSTRNYAYTNG